MFLQSLSNLVGTEDPQEVLPHDLGNIFILEAAADQCHGEKGPVDPGETAVGKSFAGVVGVGVIRPIAPPPVACEFSILVAVEQFRGPDRFCIQPERQRV